MARKRREARPEAGAAGRRLRPAAILAAVMVAAFAVKLAVLLAFHDHPLLQPDPGLDSGVYVSLATRAASGDLLLGKEPFFVSPLYIYFLAPILALTGGSLFTVRFVQILLGAAATGLLFSASRRFFGERGALIGAGLCIATGVVSFHEILILQAALDPFLTALALFLLARALEGTGEGTREADSSKAGGTGSFGAAGVAFGLLALNRPNAVLCAAAVIALLPFAEGSRRGLVRAGALAAGAMVSIAPVTLRNVAVSGEPVLISSHGGLNLYVGNGPGAEGTFRPLPGITPSIEGQARDARHVAEAAAGRPLSTQEVSAHFSRLALDWMRAHPGDATRLFLRKLGLLLNRVEVPLNLSYAWYAREIVSPLSLLAVGAGLLVPLGILGLGLRLVEAPRGPFAVWACFVPVYMLSVALFFVASRYRLPLLLPLAAGAGFAVDRLVRAVKTGDRKRLGVCAAALVPLAFLAFRPTGIDDGRANEETEMVLYEITAGKEVEARQRLARLTPKHPLPGVLWFRAGRAWLEARRPDEAAAAFERSLSIDPGQPETLLALVQALLMKDDIAGALDVLRSLPGDSSGEAGAQAEAAGLALAKAGREPEAIPFLDEACRLSPSRASAHQNLAALLAGAGRHAEARSQALEALRLKPQYPQAEALLHALDARK